MFDTYIDNCYNVGKINSSGTVGGIVGINGTTAAKIGLYIKNSYDLGKLTGNKNGKIIGAIWVDGRTETITEFTNVYYTIETPIGTGTLTSGEATLKSESEIKSQTFVDLLNANIGTNTDWKKWKLGSSGYPTFVD